MYKEEEFMITLFKSYIGVDVSKNNLDIFIYPSGRHIRIINSKSAIENFLQKISAETIEIIACEATGGYEKLLIKLAQDKFHSTWIIDPKRIKGFIMSRGCKSKTDKIDAQKIAEFAANNPKDYITIKKTENQEKLQSLVNRKQDFIGFLATEKVRLQHPVHELSKISIEKFINILEEEIQLIDNEMKKLIKDDENLDKKSKILTSIPGIGKATAAVLLSSIPELGNLSNSKVSSLVGLAPYTRESGNFKGKSFVSGGRDIPRKALYMCAIVAIKHYPALKEFYTRLINKNKPFKVAIVAVMHKLIMVANSLLKKGEMYKIA